MQIGGRKNSKKKMYFYFPFDFLSPIRNNGFVVVLSLHLSFQAIKIVKKIIKFDKEF